MDGTNLLGSPRAWRAPHERYHVEIPGREGAEALSVIAFEAVERFGEPYCITVDLAHPQLLLREDYAGHNARFTLSPYTAVTLDDAPPEDIRHFHGCITHFSHLTSTPELHTYRFVIEPRVALLRLGEASRVYQHQTAPQIIEAILRRHGLVGFQFRFQLRRTYGKHAFRLQYRINDWDYLRVLMEQEGIYCYMLQEQHGDVLIFGDDIDHYVYKPMLCLPRVAPTGLQPAQEAITALQTHAQIVPKAFTVADYHPDRAHMRLRGEANRASEDSTTHGTPYIYGTDPADEADAVWQAQLRHEAALAEQVVYEGQSTSPTLRVARVVCTDVFLPDSQHGMLITEVVHRGARDQDYRNTFRAIPSDRRFRLPLREANWPKVTGTLSARVTSAAKDKYAFITPEGRYVVRLDLDFDEWNPGGESVPLRLAKPFAGHGRTGMHYPALAGDEAIIAARDGDPNKLYIAGFHHNSVAPDLISGLNHAMSRNITRTQSGNELEMEDREGREHVRLSTPHSGLSRLTMGNIVGDKLVDGRRPQRGEGFELRTSSYGAIRSGQGLLLSTHDRPQASGMQLEMQEAMAQLQASRDQLAELSQRATAAEAKAADIEAVNRVLQDELMDLKQAVMVLSANASIALASPNTIFHSAGKNLAFASGHDTDINAMGHMHLAAAQQISLFAQQGIEHIANQGPVSLQAQNDAMTLLALKDFNIESIEGTLTLTAKKEVRIGAGGSYVLINGDGIQNVTAGEIAEKCESWNKASALSELNTARAQRPGSMVPCAAQAVSANADHAALMSGDG